MASVTVTEEKTIGPSGLGDDGENSLSVCRRFRNSMVMQKTTRGKREKLSGEAFRLGVLP